MRAELRSVQNCVIPTNQAVALFTTAGVAIVLARVFFIGGDLYWLRGVNGTLPAVIGGMCLYAGYQMVRLRPVLLWTPLPWFLAAWAVYYGFGPLVYIYGTPESVAFMDNLYPVDDKTLLRTNILNLVGLVSILGGWTLTSRIRIRPTIAERSAASQDSWRVALLFLAIGVPVKYLLELPYVLQLVDYTLPGSIQYLGSFSGLAILPLTVAQSERQRWAKSILWCLVLSEIAVGLVMLSKLQIIKTVLLVLLGRHAIRHNSRVIVTGAVIVAVAYLAVLSPFVNYARVMLGRASAQDAMEVIHILPLYSSEGRETLASVLPGVQSWWTRLAYPNAQAFAMDQYDQGKAGWTFAMAPYVLIPRFLYEDKPIMTPGFEFTRLIQGAGTSSTGLGFAGEAYWNGGWLLVIAAGFFIGTLFSWLARVSSRVVIMGRWLYAPLIFQSIYLGLRPDDWFVPTYLGGVLQALIVVAFLSLLAGHFVKRRGSRSMSC